MGSSERPRSRTSASTTVSESSSNVFIVSLHTDEEPNLLWSSRRPEAPANVCPIIAAEVANLANVRIRLRDNLIERSRDGDDVRDSMTRCHKCVTVRRDFVPPHITIERRGDFHRQPRPFDLDVRITVACECDGTTEVAPLGKLNFELLVLRCAQQHFGGIRQHSKNHRAGGHANTDIVFDDVPFALTLNGGDLDWAVIIDLAEPRQERVQQFAGKAVLVAGVLLD